MKDGKGAEIKCVIWDLDETLWNGTLLESERVHLKAGILDIVKTLDGRGILQSACSKNDFELAHMQLRHFGIAEYFLYPQIAWEPKSLGVGRIRESLNIGFDAIALIDDQEFERDEVRAAHPEVLCLDAADYKELLDVARMQPRFVTDESRQRRALYMAQIEREREERYAETPEKFLRTLALEFRVFRASEADIPRLEELTVRSNQLNATGVPYGADELMKYCASDRHLVLACELKDRYGSYGKVGVALIERLEDAWLMRLFLMSCRVVSRGVGAVFLSAIARRCREAGKPRLRAHFLDTGRNRMMFMLYKFSNFQKLEEEPSGLVTLENDLTRIQAVPSHIRLECELW